jgi:hypothetical protein
MLLVTSVVMLNLHKLLQLEDSWLIGYLEAQNGMIMFSRSSSHIPPLAPLD